MSLRQVLKRALDWWEIPAVATLAIVVLLTALYVHGLGETLPEEIGGAAPVEIVPATGVEGFKVAEFCADELTTVSFFPAPDATGEIYQLTRSRDGVAETVVVIVNAADEVQAATHYYDTAEGQRSEPGYVDDEARSCIEEKAR